MLSKYEGGGSIYADPTAAYSQERSYGGLDYVTQYEAYAQAQAQAQHVSASQAGLMPTGLDYGADPTGVSLMSETKPTALYQDNSQLYAAQNSQTATYRGPSFEVDERYQVSVPETNYGVSADPSSLYGTTAAYTSVSLDGR